VIREGHIPPYGPGSNDGSGVVAAESYGISDYLML
jgi:hypothetical protein